MRRELNLVACLTVALVIGLTTNAVSGDFSDIPIEWTTDPVQIDGAMSDWADLSTRFLGDPKAVIGLSCDSTNLYLMLRFQDSRWARMIKKAGLKLWIDHDGKKKEIFMLRYRGGPTPEQMQRLGGGANDRGGHGPGNRMKTVPQSGDDNRMFTCAIKDRIEEKSIPVSGDEGPRASFGIDQGFCVYEFAIPLDKGGVRYYGFDAQPGDEISVGVFWGDSDEMRQGGGPPAGGRGDGMGGRGGAGGGRGGMGGDRPERPEPVEFWVKTKLAEGADSGAN